MSRVRTRSDSFTNGYWIKAGSRHGFNSVRSLIETCTDEVIEGDCNNLTITRSKFSGGVANTHPVGGYYATNCFDFTLDSISGDWAQCWGEVTSYPGELPDAAYAAAAVARTNPSRPYVDIPVNILELGDITNLLKTRGESLIKKAAGHNLRYQFGIKPLVGDLVKLTHFHGAVHRRIREIERLQSPKGLRRTIQLDSLSGTKTHTDEYLQTAGPLIIKSYQTQGRRQVKAHVRWKAGGNLSKINQQEMSALATRAVLGLTVDFSTLWEAMPWSWLIDWGTNLGDYLKSQRNIIPASLMGVWLMKHSISSTTIPAFRANSHDVSQIEVVKESKTRRRVIVTPTAHFPFLTGNQLGILASLAITRS